MRPTPPGEPRPKRRSNAVLQSLIWATIAHRKSIWTNQDIADETGITLNTVQHYVTALKKSEFVREIIPVVYTQEGCTPAQHLVVNAPELAPMVEWKTSRAYRQINK